MSNDDVIPKSYKYFWSANSEIPLQDFLTKYRPSMVQNDGTKPWIWVKGSEPAKEDAGRAEALEEATELLQDVTEKVESIKNDASIPVRSNKKTGAKSKKELREQLQNEATEKLKEISVKHGYVFGKWLIFAPAEKVDQIWSSIATSLVSGPLHGTPAYLAKVSTSSPEDEKPNAQHLMCVYFPDVYDKNAAAEVMRVLLRNHGATLSGVKSNLYTEIGLDSKHASGIPSTVWKNAAVIPEKEAKELKDAFFAELASNKTAQADSQVIDAAAVKAGEEKTEAAPVTIKGKSKPKHKLKKKAEEDFFASDNEMAENKGSKASSSQTTRSKRPQADEEDEEEQPKKKSIRK